MKKTMTALEALYFEVDIATDNFDREHISELKPQVEEMAVTFPDNSLIEDMREWITEAEKAIAQYDEYEQLRLEVMPELVEYFNGDTYTAELVAEDIAYSTAYSD